MTRKISLALVLLLLLTPLLPALAAPVTVTDAAGREVTIPEEPRRVVSCYFISTSMVIALGQKEKLVGIESKAATREIYRLAAPELISLPGVGTMKQLDLEGILSLKPDLVILPLAQLPAAETLSEMGVPAITVNPENHDLLRETIVLLGDALGADSAPLLQAMTETEDLLRDLVTGVTPVRVYLAGNSEMLRTAGKNMYQHTLLTMAGALNAAEEITDGYWVNISYEQLLSWNPEVIVIAAQAGYSAEDILGDPLLQEVSAVKNGRVYAFPASPEAWDSPCPASALGSLWLAHTLYPDRVSEETLTSAVNGFYSVFYGIGETP